MEHKNWVRFAGLPTIQIPGWVFLAPAASSSALCGSYTVHGDYENMDIGVV